MDSLRYDGPQIDISTVRAWRTVLTEELARPPSVDEIVKRIHQTMFAGLSEDYVRIRVEGALKLEEKYYGFDIER